ncbi:hypothetical protein EPUS_06353 [Endocarpon pusillum Z07020]|uniref:Elongation factor 2 n=1 Tax=Endocarpon pusillum (strain Z07020 / HMAS-L-300199) TaxID=1263415 RepID=U1FZE8_ENDPU|nr:uncharacterized protein EPUS_06353 [Endocarpon pusillum Z07020]ERF70312.1 hypothetical protein EPUS_06353 [Endocarpon pusillum Z07020]
MAGVASLTAQSLDPGRTFNWIYLVELLVCGILTLFFLFYFNRLFATLVSYGLRAYTWHKYRVYVDIQALQISLLGGRIFFKGIRYHGENETILIQNGYLTWNYWLRSVRQADCARFVESGRQRSAGSSEESGSPSNPCATESSVKESGPFQAVQDLPSRISVSISGFEWFVYNRSPAYDTIATSEAPNTKQHAAQPNRNDLRKSSSPATSKNFSLKSVDMGNHQPNASPQGCNLETRSAHPTSATNTMDWSTLLLLTLFPILIECKKGAIVIGNEHTRAILMTSFEELRGHIDAAKSGLHDIYRQIFEFDVTHPVVQMKPNPDYRQPQQAAAQNIIRNATPVHVNRSWWEIDWRFRRRKRKVMHGMRTLMPYFRRSVESFRPSSVDEQKHVGTGNWPNEIPGERRWLGLSRYLDEEERDDHEGWSNVEYARFSQVVDCPSVHLSLYWDVPGVVEQDPASAGRIETDHDTDLGKPPAYGLDLILRGGKINYGPWADRARAEIQNIFFPSSYRDAVPADPVSVGSSRQSTIFSVHIHIENETSLRLPTRENSKDWQWKGRAGALRGASGMKQQSDKKHTRKKKDEKNLLGPDVRPFGWFAVSVLPNSTIAYNMGMIARKQGYHNDLELDLKGTKMTTSVNHAQLWSCGPQKISCDLSNPLGWNTFHEWAFDVQSHNMDLFLLRDHIFLLADLVNDFTSGPTGEFLTFVPFMYRIKLSFTNVKLYLNANDSNIIDNPCDLEENTFLMLHGKTLQVVVDIPLVDYAPSDHRINFQAWAQDARLDLATPAWNTAHTFASDMPTANLEGFSMDGCYNYFSSTSPSLTDSLFLNLRGLSPRIFLHGSLIKYCIKLKDNYFGDDVHFRTLEEYQELLAKQKCVMPEPLYFRNKKENDLDVILNVAFERVCALLPANVYSRKENLRLEFLFVEADVRFTNYYMDVEAMFSPVKAAWESVKDEEAGIDNHVSKPQAFVDGIRVYGHRLFGLAPSEPTYVCNWDFDVGKVTGECVTDFVHILLRALKSFSFTLEDDENALPQSHIPKIHDVTFLSARIGNINLCFFQGETAILFRADGIEITFNDWAGKRFSDRLQLEIPNIQVAAVDKKGATRHRDEPTSVVPTHALFRLSILLRMVGKNRDFERERQLQQHHIQFHDQRTHRTRWLLHEPVARVQTPEQRKSTRPNPPAMTVPHMPAPLSEGDCFSSSARGTEIRSHGKTSNPRLRHKSAFFSKASSLGSSSLQSRRDYSKVTNSRVAQPSYSQRSSSAPRPRDQDGGDTVTVAFNAAASEEHVWADREVAPNWKSTTTYSSPWTAPYFPLVNIAPETGHLPLKPFNTKLATKTSKRGGDGLEVFEDLDDDHRHRHSLLDIDLGADARGFASPKFFTAVATLVKALQPVHPTDLLDGLQIDTVTQLQKLANTGTGFAQTTDYCIRVPFAHLRILDADCPWQATKNEADRDQYDLQVVRLKMTARSSTKEKRPRNNSEVENCVYLHVVLQRSLLEVHDQSADVLNDKAAARVSIEDLVLWIASDGRTVAKFQQRDLQITSWGSRIEYLASLIHRTVELSAFVVGQFTSVDLAARIPSLVYYLTEVAGGSTDPVFLTRPSYVLRTADHHLRLNDSWKIISRLRQMLHSLGSHQQSALLQKCTSPDISLPPNAKALVLATFDKWRSWDLADVSKSLIMELIWGKFTPKENSMPQNGGLTLEFTLDKVSLILDPGPKENQIAIHGIGTAISTAEESRYDMKHEPSDVFRPRIVTVQIYCSSFGIHLNWELVELIGETMELFNSEHRERKGSTDEITNKEQLPVPVKQLHFVVGLDAGVVTFDSININLAMAASGVRGSMLHQVDAKAFKTTNLLLMSRSASASLRDDEAVLLDWLLYNTTVSLCRTVPLSPSSDLAVPRATAKCERLDFEIKEDINNSLKVANRVIRDEVNILNGMAARLNARSQSLQTKEHSNAGPQQHIYIALLLTHYTLSVAILPSLTYVISGNGARTSAVPRTSSRMIINFDLEDNSHAFKLQNTDTASQVAMLKIPPINSKVILCQSTKSTNIMIDTTLNEVDLDARSVRSCVDIINKPEVVRSLVNAKKSVQHASAQLDTIFSSQTGMDAETSSHSTTLLYKAKVTLVGLKVHVSAPALKSQDYRSDLDFVLGLTTFRSWNEDVQQGVVHERPQFDVAFRRISLNVYRRRSGVAIKSGNLDFSGQVTGRTSTDGEKNQIQLYHAASVGLNANLSAETASLIVDIAAHLQERIKSFTLADEVKRLKPLRRLTTAGLSDPPMIKVSADDGKEEEQAGSSSLFDSVYSLDLNAISIAWRLDAKIPKSTPRQAEDLVFSIRKVNLNTKREGSATLTITDLQLQMVPKSLEAHERSLNSALMPDVVFKVAYLSTKKGRRFAFQAAGKALDLRLTSDFIVPATALRASLAAASAELREGSALWASQPVAFKKESTSLFGRKYLASLLIDADFAGAVVNIQARKPDEERKSVFGILKGDKRSRAGRYDQAVQGDGATLRAPGVAMKVEYSDNGRDDPSLNAEIKVAASSNVLYPSVVPLITEASSSIKEIVGSPDDSAEKPIIREIQKPPSSPTLASSKPTNLMGRCKLDLSIWIRKQEFSLSCQPIARVAATAKFSDSFIAVNTVQSPEQGRFFALSANFSDLHASVQHVYSRESTASFEVDSIVLSMMNSKHVSNITGVSAILNVSPMKASVNAKQLQDFLLFREIWYPAELRQTASSPTAASAAPENQAIVVQRYQQVAAAGAFPWNAVVAVQELTVQVDLGQSLGKSIFTVSQLWASSKKASDFEQNLCLGFEKIGVECTGRMSGFVELQNFRVRTSIRWPQMQTALEQIPLVQASLGLDQLRVKAAFDYQPFAIAEISKFEFLMYNIRPRQSGEKDRLLGNLEGEKVQVFCTTGSASQALALYQAVVRLVQEKEAAYETSLKELDRYLRRKSVFPSSTWTAASTEPGEEEKDVLQGPFSLHTKVVVTLRAVNVGAFPTTFFDNQIFKVEAKDAQARFAVSAKEGKTHSGLGLTLGQLRVALSNVNRSNTQALGEVSVSDVVSRATGSRGGTILKVPKVVATMQTWQGASSNSIEYIFKSTFEGKVDVGWNYSRISFIRGMWSTHLRALASRLGKPLPQSAVQITGGPQPDDKGEGKNQEKITAGQAAEPDASNHHRHFIRGGKGSGGCLFEDTGIIIAETSL